MEWMLIVGILGFYLQDSALLLYRDELVAVRSGRRWQVSLGDIEVGGRYLFVPNPLAPWRMLFRAVWMTPWHDAPPAPPGCLQALAARLRPLGAGCAILALLLLVAMPMLVLLYPYAPLLLALLAACYLVIAAMLLYMLRARSPLRLTGKDVATLAIGGLLCPPHAINMVRKVCLMHTLDQDPLLFAAGVLEEEERAQLRDELEARLLLLESFEVHPSPALHDSRHRIGDALP